MKNLIYALLLIFLSSFSIAHANTQIPTNEVSTNCTTWTKNLSCADKTQDLVNNVVDQLSGGSGSPGGSNTEIQYNNNGNFAGGLMYYVNGNVGIGTTSPSSLLYVNGNSIFYGTITAGTATNGNSVFSTVSNGGDIQLGTGVFGGNTLEMIRSNFKSSGDFDLRTLGNLEIFTGNGTSGSSPTPGGFLILQPSGGNVGIGTTSPNNTIQVLNLLTFDNTLYNTDIGYRAGNYGVTTGKYNNANGYEALYANTTGISNTANGYQALYTNTTGNNNTANGTYALYSNTTGNYNNANGYEALYANTTGISNTANGYQALYTNTTGNNNTANGTYALYSNTTGNYNNANGYEALYTNTTGNYNNANGYEALYTNTTGNNNTANGYQALYTNTTGNNKTANGYQALYYNTTNVATLGSITGGSLYTTGTYTGVVMTLSSGSSATTYPTATIVVNAGGAVSSVTITSPGAGFKDTTTVLTAPAASIGGTGSGFSVPVATLNTAANNTALGYQAGRYISGGSTVNSWSTNSTYLGMNAYPLADGDVNETVLGYGAVGNGSNTVTIGGTGTTGTIIPYGNVGIGSTNPGQALDVQGTVRAINFTTFQGNAIKFVAPAQAGVYLGLPAAQNDSVGANVVEVAMFYLPYQLTVKNIGVSIQIAGGAGSTINVGIYTADGNTKLIDSGTLAATSTVYVTSTVNVTLNQGFYWCAYSNTDSTTRVYGYNSYGHAGLDNDAHFSGTAANSTSGGVLPSTLGTITANSSGNNYPYVILTNY